MITMKRILFVLSLLSFLSAQNTKDENGLKNGDWYGFYETGEVRYKGHFNHGIPDGEFVHYYVDKQIKALNVFRNNGDTMEATVYHKYPIVAAEGLYSKAIETHKDGTKDTVYHKQGVWKFFDANGKLASKESFKNDLLDGDNEVYYLTGQVHRKCNYRNGVEHGLYQEFFKNGNVQVEGQKLDGNFDGIVQYFHENGIKWQRGKYQAAVKHGLWMIFDKSGKLEGKYYFNRGRLLESEQEINKFKEQNNLN